MKTRKKREKTGKKWARYGLRSVGSELSLPSGEFAYLGSVNRAARRSQSDDLFTAFIVLTIITVIVQCITWSYLVPMLMLNTILEAPEEGVRGTLDSASGDPSRPFLVHTS